MTLPGTDTDMRIGLLGGSFNPAHSGHRNLSLVALKHLKLDVIWWLVSPQNPLKGADDTAPIEERMHVAQLVADHPRIIVTNIESAIGTQYTADTLKALTFLYPRSRFVWLMGADNLEQIPKWDRWNKIFETMPVAIINRPPPTNNGTKPNFRAALGKAAQRYHHARVASEDASGLPLKTAPAWTYIRSPLNPMSSTALRLGRTG